MIQKPHKFKIPQNINNSKQRKRRKTSKRNFILLYISNYHNLYFIDFVYVVLFFVQRETTRVNGKERETTEAYSRSQILVPQHKPKLLATPPRPLMLRLREERYIIMAPRWELSTPRAPKELLQQT